MYQAVPTSKYWVGKSTTENIYLFIYIYLYTHTHIYIYIHICSGRSFEYKKLYSSRIYFICYHQWRRLAVLVMCCNCLFEYYTPCEFAHVKITSAYISDIIFHLFFILFNYSQMLGMVEFITITMVIRVKVR